MLSIDGILVADELEESVAFVVVDDARLDPGVASDVVHELVFVCGATVSN